MQRVVQGLICGIVEHESSDLEAYSVFAKIQLRFAFVPIKLVIIDSQFHRDNLGREENAS